MDLDVGSQLSDGDPAIELVKSQPLASGRKKGTSCARCRRPKIRCNDGVPSCGTCARDGQVCVRAHLGNSPDVVRYGAARKRSGYLCVTKAGAERISSSHINYAEARLRLFEDALRRVAPEEFAKLLGVDKPPTDVPGSHIRLALSVDRDEDTASRSASVQIGPGEPLDHEVILLSLANSRDHAPVTGTDTSWVTSGGLGSRGTPRAQPFPMNWTTEVVLQHFVDAYFETHHPLHPFLDEGAVSDRLEILYAKLSPALDLQQMPQLSEI
ncbi:hypothetical protein GGR54DRAFT_645737 [Hypoxylon sp. NC1633]|nr:hypothetical protein GGR54DRAFT_645737 [Hypoxylon sp. NC1633]